MARKSGPGTETEKDRRSRKSGKTDGPGQTKPETKGRHNAELLDMSEAIRLLKTTRPTFYRWLRSGKIRGMKVGRQWRFERKEIERFLRGEEPRIELRTDISPLIKDLDGKLQEVRAKETSFPVETEVERAVNMIIRLAMATRATDIHIAPTIAAGGSLRLGGRPIGALRLRVDGALHPVLQFDARLLPPVIEQFKRLAACNPQENTRPQDGRLMFEYDEKPVDMRLHFLPAVHGETLTARILLPGKELPSLEDIDFTAKDKEKILKAIKAPSGVILVTGPAGSGKTTTIYACLSHINSPQLKVMTAEEPVEYAFPWMVQVQVDRAAGITFPVAIRSILRSDADALAIGELRETETLQLALAAAVTGHLVFSTLHTNDAAHTLTRMVEMGGGGEPFLVAEATTMVIAQRLVRLLCPHCALEENPPASVLARAERMARSGGIDWDGLRKSFHKPIGCDECGQIGYRGRNIIAEVLEMSPTIGAAVRRGTSADDIRAIAVGEGMTTMAAHGILKAAHGETSLHEVMRVVGVE